MDYKKLSEEIKQKFSKHLESPEIVDFIKSMKSTNEDSGTFEVVITTENIDRYDEIIKADGWELDNYMKNPVVLWGHDHYAMPIGLCTSIEKVDSKLVAKGKFAPTEMGQSIRRLYDLGIVRATSVGFIEKERTGNVITKAELLEFSFVSVPANPMCLSTMQKSGVSINEMITKGIVFFKEVSEEETKDDPESIEVKEEEEVVEDKEPTTEEIEKTEEAEDTEETVDDEIIEEAKGMTKKEVIEKIKELKTIVLALEGLVEEAPEREETTEDDEDAIVDETPEEKSFRLFNESRRFMQLASTALSESLAETRRVINPKK